MDRSGETISRLRQELAEWREEAWQCFLACGEDPDGADARHLNPGEALAAVKQLRNEGYSAYDEGFVDGEKDHAERLQKEGRP